MHTALLDVLPVVGWTVVLLVAIFVLSACVLAGLER